MKTNYRFFLLLSTLLICLMLTGVSASAAEHPATPTNLRHSSSKTKIITVKWNTSGRADGYEVYMSKDSEDFKKIAITKRDSYMKGNLKVGQKYTFRVRAYKNSKDGKLYSGFSNTVTIKATKMNKAAESVHTAYYNATLKKDMTLTNRQNNQKISLKKGTQVVATAYDGTPVCYYYVNGKLKASVKISHNSLNYTSLKTTTQDYSTKVKESYVNGRAYYSETDYLIWVSQYTLRVNVFKGSRGKWKLVRTIPCIIGALNTRTPVGIYDIKGYKREGYGGYPLIYFTNYSEKYNSANAFHNYVDSNRGQAAVSHGCIRMAPDNLMWIYNNCKLGTRVVTF
ncbi:MAG: L,D-transpeptidase family protein [Eubacteriales bacterium]|nr:L,D-transpeptidase family protein [Eubacteriales bacterium]